MDAVTAARGRRLDCPELYLLYFSLGRLVVGLKCGVGLQEIEHVQWLGAHYHDRLQKITCIDPRGQQLALFLVVPLEFSARDRVNVHRGAR